MICHIVFVRFLFSFLFIDMAMVCWAAREQMV